MVTVGVTGASGFIGGALVPFLAAKGHDLKLLDDFSGPITVIHPRWPVNRADIRVPDALDVLDGADVVLHLASASGVVACASDPIGSAEINVNGTRRVVDWCRGHSVPLAFASSFAVVGVPEYLPITEETPARPTHEYARQKSEGEALTRSLSAEDSAQSSAVLRMSNVFGRYEANGTTVAKSNVLNLFATQARAGSLVVNAPGTQRRDFVHLEDVLRHWEATVRLLAEHPGSPTAHTFNVASGETSTILELAQRVADHWDRLHPGGVRLRIDVVPNPRGAIELLQPEFEVSRDHTERVLGVEIRRSLENSIDEILGGPRAAEPGTSGAAARSLNP